MQHISSNNLDNPNQSVYKTGHSTETAFLHLKNEVRLSLSRGEPTVLVLLDLSIDFDTTIYSQASSLLKQLHWLPVEFHCIFKTAT